MKLTMIKMIGKRAYPFEFEGLNLHECIMESQKLSFNDVAKCGLCGSDDLILNARIAKNFKYTEIKCKKCGASLTFGQKMEDPNTYYLRRKEDKSLDWKAMENK